MEIFTIILVVLGLCVFEVINSVDNAIINAHILLTMRERYRRLFLVFGIFFAVFVIRGALPWLIIWFSTPSIGPAGALTASFSTDPGIMEIIKSSSPVLLVGASTFLLFLFFHWLFLEPKKILLSGEKFFQSHFFLFYAFVSILLSTIIWFALHKNAMMAFGAVVGATAFYIVEAVRRYADENKHRLHQKNISDISKILYLEVIDASFSIDGVLGAFAFTLSVPLILIGNGLGALVVRQLTIKNINIINKYRYLTKGAMYSILFMGFIMMFNSFGYNAPGWLPPVVTFAIVGYSFYISKREIKNNLK